MNTNETQPPGSLTRMVRWMSRWAWSDLIYDAARVEWKYGRYDSGAPKQWDEWENLRDDLREIGALRQPCELDAPSKQ